MSSDEPDSVSALQRAGTINVTLRVAVTGHRTLSDDEALGEKVDEAVDHLLRLSRSPSEGCTEVGLVVISAIAEGADRLVVHRMMSRGAELEVLLPLRIEDYKEDFKTEESRTEFDCLCAAARLFTVLPPADSRQDAYLQAGRAVVDHCDVLLAIWDGQLGRGSGGTADTVRYARDRGVPLIWITTEGGHAISPQLGNSPAEWPDLFPLSAEGLDRLNEFNSVVRDLEDFNRAMQSLTQKSVASVGSGIEQQVQAVVKWAHLFYARASCRAIYYRRWYDLLSGAIILLAFSAVAVVSAQLIFASRENWIVWIEVTLLSLLLVSLFLGRGLRLHEKWITSRYLSESLRCALFLALVGVSEGDRRSDLHHTDEDPTQTWLRRAYAEVWWQRPRITIAEEHVDFLQRFLADNWIHDQIVYHEDRTSVCERKDRRATRAMWALLVLSLVAAILHSLGVLADHEVFLWWGYAAIILPAGIAALGTLTAQREYRKHARRYRQMAERLADCEGDILLAEDLRRIQEVALETDRVMRQESGDWFDVVRLHELEPV